MSYETREKNKEVILNFGLIAYGQLKIIEELQAIIEKQFEGRLRVLFQTVTAKRLHIIKGQNSEGKFEYLVKIDGED
jgi:hypothetical protein